MQGQVVDMQRRSMEARRSSTLRARKMGKWEVEWTGLHVGRCRGPERVWMDGWMGNRARVPGCHADLIISISRPVASDR